MFRSTVPIVTRAAAAPTAGYGSTVALLVMLAAMLALAFGI